MTWLRRFDVLLLACISAIALVVSIGDALDLFTLPFIGRDKIASLTLVLVGLIGVYLVSFHFRSTNFEAQIENQLLEIPREVGNAYVRVFEDSVKLETYIARRIREANTEVCDLSWKNVISAGFQVGKRKKSHKKYESGIAAVSKSEVLYREIYIFNDKRRVEKLIRRIDENKDMYSCRYFPEDNVIPRLQFLIIDRKEVIFFASSSSSILCAVYSEDVAKVFHPYFERLWETATPIKEGNIVYRDIYNSIINGVQAAQTPNEQG